MSKITLTPNASGTGTFTVASPNSNTNRTLTLPDEAGELLINGTTSNVGIGVSPSAWSTFNALEMSNGVYLGSFTGGTTAGYLGTNNYFNGSNFIYKNSDFATRYQQVDGKHQWFNAPSGTAGNAISFTQAMTLDASGRVGIGTSSPTALLDLKHNSASTHLRLTENTSGNWSALGVDTSDNLRVYVNNSERMRIDSSGNLLVGTTTANSNNTGIGITQDDVIYVTRSNGRPLLLNRQNSDGDIAEFRKDGSTVGTIGSKNGALYIGSTTGSDSYLGFYSNQIIPTTSYGSDKDAVTDLGYSGSRFNDIYATNGTIQTSDRNEKQDIEALSDAEQRVAVACKGLLRKFRWIDAVAEKGDDARIHFGIIAQDLQDAFAAEGLDAGRYAMFISSTWWETQTEVPAVEAVDAVYEDVVIPAVLDEEGNELEAERTEQQLVTEAVEAKDAYTRTDTYETQEEAPEGATERTRLGVRYPELLAFIIGAM